MAEDFLVPTAGGRLFARFWRGLGKAAPIVLFHDSLGSVELWRDFPEKLCAHVGRSVLAYDRLGFGRSDAYEGRLASDFIPSEARTSLPALREKFAIEKMILFGHSVGGGMAVGAGAAFPEATLAVVTESAQAFVEDRTRAGIREAQAVFEQPGQIDRLRRYHGDKAQWVLDAWTKTWLSPDFDGWKLDELAALKCPVLALHGDRDEYGSDLHPQQIGGRPTGKIVILGDCGHVPHREKPDDVLTAVSDFLRNFA